MHWQSTSFFMQAGPVYFPVQETIANSPVSSSPSVDACRSAIAIRLCWPWPPLSRQILLVFQRVSTNLNKLLPFISCICMRGAGHLRRSTSTMQHTGCLRSVPYICPLYQALPSC